MDEVEVRIDRSLIRPEKERIATLLGNPPGSTDHQTMDLIGSLITGCLEVMSPRGGYAIRNATPVDTRETIAIENVEFQTGKIITKQLAGTERYGIFLASAGSGPEILSRSLMEKGHFLEGYIADLVGSGIAESVANQVQSQIRELALSQDRKTTNRYSPGYCDWDVSEQQKLFSFFPEGFCGITLSGSSLMSPIKSVSGITGIGKEVSYNDYICEACGMKNCIFREVAPRASGPMQG